MIKASTLEMTDWKLTANNRLIRFWLSSARLGGTANLISFLIRTDSEDAAEMLILLAAR